MLIGVWPGSGLPPVAQVFNLCLSIAADRRVRPLACSSEPYFPPAGCSSFRNHIGAQGDM